MTPQDLLNEFHALAAEAEAMMADALSERSANAAGNPRTRLDAAQKRLSDVYDQARQKVIAGAKCTDETIRANPYQALAIAAGVGFLVGLLLGRRQ